MKRILAVSALVVAAGCQALAPSAPATMEWSRHAVGLDGAGIAAVVPGGDGLLAVGGPGGDGGSGIWTSTDGLGWRSVDPVRPGRALADIVAGGPGFVALSGSPMGVWTSPDGLTWTESPPDPDFADSQLSALAAADGVLVAVGFGQPLVSADGITWRKVQLPGAGGTLFDVTAGGPGFVAVGSRSLGAMRANAIVFTSTDGASWTQVPDHPDFQHAELHGVAATDGRVIAVGYANDEERGIFAAPAAWTSTDGLAWRRAEVIDELVPVRTPPFSGALEGAIMGPTSLTSKGWVSTGAAFTAGPPDGVLLDLPIWTSADGSRWVRAPHQPQFELGIDSGLAFAGRAVIEFGGQVLILGTAAGPQASVWTSPPRAGGIVPPPRPTAGPSGSAAPIDATPAPPAPPAPSAPPPP
jgi:hypothetical protein